MYLRGYFCVRIVCMDDFEEVYYLIDCIYYVNIVLVFIFRYWFI